MEQGQKLLIGFTENRVLDAVVLAHAIVAINGDCTLTTEHLLVAIKGLGKRALERHSIAPDEDPWWCIQGPDGEYMVLVMEAGTDAERIKRLLEESAPDMEGIELRFDLLFPSTDRD